jgi:hypothetical protein
MPDHARAVGVIQTPPPQLVQVTDQFVPIDPEQGYRFQRLAMARQ